MKSLFLRCAFVVLSIAISRSNVQAAVVSFGSGTNVFQMEFVTIGNPGNAADTAGAPNPAGSVGYKYGMGKFEVSVDAIDKYNASQTLPYLQISRDNRGSNKPATAVSWNEAARFVNWLNTSKNLFPAYKIATGININWNIDLWDPILDPLDYDPSNRFRSKRATYVLPNANEWYKAAYYDSTTQSYYRYTTGSNSKPTPVPFGTDANTAVFGRQPDGPSDVHLAGGLSPYGVMGLGGNVYEWEETSGDPTNSNTGSYRIIRGGFWYDYYDFFEGLSSSRDGRLPGVEGNDIGFRVATLNPSGSEVPEPSMMVIGTLFGLGGLVAKRRMRK